MKPDKEKTQNFVNDKFFKLPLEKQRRIINAAYKVFSENSYKKAPMSEIADESGISKALLFHYFTNKKELYMYLWTDAIEMTRKAVTEYRTLETDDFFEMPASEMTVLIDFWEKVYTQEV